MGQGKYACFLYYCKIAIVLTALVLKIVLLFMFKFFFLNGKEFWLIRCVFRLTKVILSSKYENSE